jgi:Fe-S cluster assembly scaffold protein SufB
MLEWRLKAYRAWLEMEEVDWAKLDIPAIDYQDAYYYAAPKAKPKLGSLDEVDPEILRVYEKLGIPIEEQKVLAGVEGARKVAVDAGVRQRQRRHHIPRGTESRRRHLPVDFGSGAGASGAGAEVPRLGGAATR